MRRLLLIAHCFPPNPAPGSARAWRIYKYLPEFGYETYVVTASQPDVERERVLWVPAPPKTFAEKVLRKFFFPYDEQVLWSVAALRAARRLIRHTPMDAVLSTVPFLPEHLVALALKKANGLPWVADYRDPIVGNPFRSAKGMPGAVDRFLDGLCFTNADLLVAVTDRVEREWKKRCPWVADKTAVIWNGYDPEEAIAARPIPARPYRLVSHFGSFYGSRTPVPLLESVMRLIVRGLIDPKQFRFRFVGPIDPAIVVRNGELFEHLIAAGSLELVPPIPRVKALYEMTESDSLLLADNNRAAMGHTVPAKLFEYIRVGRPVLALTVEGSPVEQILAMSGVRFASLYPQMDEEHIDARLLEFLRMPTQPANLRAEFLTEFNGRDQARRLAGLIDRIVGEPLTPTGTPAERASSELVEV